MTIRLHNIFFLVLFFEAITFQLLAQNANVHLNDRRPTREFIIDIVPHTSGLALGVNYGFIKKNGLTHAVHLELTSLKHPKEVRQRSGIGNSFGNATRNYIYGKRNQFYGIHAGYSGKIYFSKKAENQGVAIGLSYAAGPSLGMIKPYYLNLNINGEITSQAYTEEYRAQFLNVSDISGAAGFKYGFNELDFALGGFARLGLNFDWGKSSHRWVKAIDAGIMLDVYTKVIPIMLTEDNQAIFPTLYAAFQIGKRI